MTVSRCGQKKLYVSARYRYNYLSEKIEEIHYLDDSVVFDDYTYVYNNKHQVVKCVNHLSGKDSRWNVIYTYRYNEMGDIIEEVTKQNRAILKTTHKYDYTRNKNLQKRNDDVGLMHKTYPSKYNDSGNRNDGDSDVKLEYLDRAGNWLKKTEFSRGLPPRITKRVIVYY